MNNYILKKYHKYILIMTLIFTFSFVFAGKITVEERGKEIFTGEKYKTVMVQKDKGSIKITDGERDFTVKREVIEGLRRLEGLIKYTPLHTVVYAAENLS